MAKSKIRVIVLLIVLVAYPVLRGGIALFSGYANANLAQDYENQLAIDDNRKAFDIDAGPFLSNAFIEAGIEVTYVFIFLGVIGILGFSIMHIAKNPSAAKSALFGIVGLLVVFVVTYVMSDGSDATTVFADEGITEAASKNVGMGLRTFYVLTAAAIVAILYVEVSRLFSK